MENTRNKKCPHCGHVSDINAASCAVCGRSFEKNKQPIESSKSELEISDARESNVTKIIVIVLVLAILALLIIALVSTLSSETPEVFETATYRKTFDEGLTSIQDYTYKDSVVYSMRDTVVIKTSSLNEDDIAAYIERFDALALEVEGIEYITYIKEITDSKLTLGFEYTGLEDKETVRKLTAAGYISTDYGNVISMSKTEEFLINNGYRLTTVS